jgi:hypothetical protein
MHSTNAIKITVRTRSSNIQLYERMKSFIPPQIECIRDTEFFTWEGAATFLHHGIENTEGILLVVDDDAFITDWTAVESLCKLVKDNRYTHAGIPDGGIIEHRAHSFLNLNPFLAVFNCDIIRPLKSKINRRQIDETTYSPEMDHLKPDWVLGKYDHDYFEPYAGFFYWLAKVGKPLFLKVETLWDGISTKVFGINNETLCLHSWYARAYATDPVSKNRIDAIFRLASRTRKQSI